MLRKRGRGSESGPGEGHPLLAKDARNGAPGGRGDPLSSKSRTRLKPKSKATDRSVRPTRSVLKFLAGACDGDGRYGVLRLRMTSTSWASCFAQDDKSEATGGSVRRAWAWRRGLKPASFFWRFCGTGGSRALPGLAGGAA